MFAKLFDILNEVPGGVLGKLGMRRGLAAATLVEQNDPVGLRIMKAAHESGDAASWTAVEKHRRFALWIATFLEVDLVKRRDFEAPSSIRGDFRKQGVITSHAAISFSTWPLYVGELTLRMNPKSERCGRMADYRVIIVDDHPLFRDALKQILTAASPGIAIDEAGTIDAVTAALTNDRDFDLVLLDLKMPGV